MASIAQILARNARRVPTREALVFEGARYTILPPSKMRETLHPGTGGYTSRSHRPAPIGGGFMLAWSHDVRVNDDQQVVLAMQGGPRRCHVKPIAPVWASLQAYPRSLGLPVDRDPDVFRQEEIPQPLACGKREVRPEAHHTRSGLPRKVPSPEEVTTTWRVIPTRGGRCHRGLATRIRTP